MLTDAWRLWFLRRLLRLMGAASAAAFLTMLMPPDVMAAIHERLGLGPFPRSPVVDYLARSAAGLYGFHGVLVLLVSTDPVRYRPVVTYIGVMHLTFGMMIIAIDSVAGMPWWWTAGEGPAIIPFGLILLVLNRSAVHFDDHAGNLTS